MGSSASTAASSPYPATPRNVPMTDRITGAVHESGAR